MIGSDLNKRVYNSHVITSTNPRQRARAKFEIEPNLKCFVQQVNNFSNRNYNFLHLIVYKDGGDGTINFLARARISDLND